MLNKENHINISSSTLNIVAIITGVFLMTIIYLLRVNLLPIISIFDYFRLLFFISIVFILPDYINSKFKKDHRWYYSIESITILSLLFFCISGLIFGRHISYISYFIIPVGIYLIIWELKRLQKFNNLISITFGLVSVIFFIVIFYSQGWHSPLFPEQIILGPAFIDTLFHTSISNMFSTLGYASSGLDGAPYIHYHWGTHGLFAGMRTWINFSTISFYNIGYPLIFIPLFFKAFFLLTHRIFMYKNQISFDMVLGFSAMIFLYSVGALGFSEARAMPMNSESFGISIILSLLYLSALLVYVNGNKSNDLYFIAFSFVIISLLFLFKISTGYVMFLGLSFLLIRTRPNFKSGIIVLLCAAIIATLVYQFIYPVFRNETSVSIGNRLFNYWELSAGFITYFIGILILLFALIYETNTIKYSKLIGALKTRKYIDLEVLAMINLAGAGGAIWVTSYSGDVYYFFAVQLFLSTVYILYYANIALGYLKLGKNSMNLLLAFLVIFAMLASPFVIPGIIRLNQPNKGFSDLSEDQLVLKELIIGLIELDKLKDKNKLCIYIPQEEDWYHNNQKGSFKESFIVPAVSGIAAINSIPQKLLQSNFNYFSIAYYRNSPGPIINNLENAKIKAKIYGYEELIVYTKANDTLEKQSYPLN